MKEVTLKLYKFDELDESAQQRVIDDERGNCGTLHEEFWCNEYQATLDEFCKIIGCKVSWTHEYGNFYYRIKWDNDPFECWQYDVYIDSDHVKGKYLLRFLNRDEIYFSVRKGKYRSTPFRTGSDGKQHYRYIHSKVMFEEGNCPLTGYCADNSILQPIWDWHKNPDLEISLQELVEKCLDSFFEDWQADIDWGYTDDYVREELENNCDEDFYEDGTRADKFLQVA